MVHSEPSNRSCVRSDRTSRPDELDISAKSAVAKDPEFYFKTARPPLLKDFFDPNIRKVLQVRRPVRSIEVNFEVKSFLLNE